MKENNEVNRNEFIVYNKKRKRKNNEDEFYIFQ